MLKQMLQQVLKQNPSKTEAKSKQSQRQCFQALLRLMHQSSSYVMADLAVE